MESFTAIDFETAQGYRHSICQVGLVRIEKGIITAEMNILIQPPDNYYWSRFTDIHGISPEDTIAAPTFDKVWNQIAPFIENQNVVAHNGFAFDFPVLSKTLEYYGLPTPDYNKFCTYRIFKSNLANLCSEFEIKLNHHDALSDAKACGQLFKMHLNK
ncbi:DNA polymerase-3 subunit epsilon [Flavobacterium micromati]|uniref:DNA polymerase-3 subunit epsilon n=1 Tax=Flavobacterium micromati TaxID=229205 RepID=A0A1M5M634_9FLAO|nr:3'-5' exonuclease [Flavobacterium micromati]MCL6462786.1 3'-5' exonuclease [Flavobacterium micromati]SHG72712.1 DNA polymerase-3 subunit epsilon [Flavobacterium micromati]